MPAELRRRAWQRWQAAAGRWRGWAVCPALMLPPSQVAWLSIGRSGESRLVGEQWPVLADELARSLAPGGAAVELDVEPCLGVRVAAELAARGLAHAVLVLPRWPHPMAVLPVGSLVAALTESAERLDDHPRQQLPNVVFVLDGERAIALGRRPAGDRRVDNRYATAAGDLPNLGALRRAGMQRVIRCTADGLSERTV